MKGSGCSLFEEFDGKPEDVHQHIARFTQSCDKTGVVEDFSFAISENLPPSDVDLSVPKEKTALLSDPCCFNNGNFLLDASQAMIKKSKQLVIKLETASSNSPHRLFPR
jgi:hypothetical protein